MEGILSLTLRKKVNKKFGGRMKAMVSGGAPLNPDVGLFFQAMGLPMLFDRFPAVLNDPGPNLDLPGPLLALLVCRWRRLAR